MARYRKVVAQVADLRQAPGNEPAPVAEAAPERTKAELLERAAELDIAGRSGMNKAELEAAIAEAEA